MVNQYIIYLSMERSIQYIMSVGMHCSHHHKEGVMNVKGLSKAGVLFVIVAAASFIVPSGFAADQPSKGSGGMELKA